MSDRIGAITQRKAPEALAFMFMVADQWNYNYMRSYTRYHNYVKEEESRAHFSLVLRRILSARLAALRIRLHNWH